MWRANRARVLPQGHTAAMIAVEARDRGCWRNELTTRQKNRVAAVAARRTNQEVRSRREKVAIQQRRRAEAGNFGKCRLLPLDRRSKETVLSAEICQLDSKIAPRYTGHWSHNSSHLLLTLLQGNVDCSRRWTQLEIFTPSLFLCVCV